MPAFVYFDGGGSIVFGGVQAQSNPTNPTTFPSMTFGTAAGTRYVAIGLAYISGSAVSSVTIGGITATQVVALAGSSVRAEIWVAAVPTGTSGNVVVTGQDGVSFNRGMACAIWSLYDLASGTAIYTASDATSPFTLNPTGSDLVVIGVLHNLADGTTATWSGVTEDADGAIVILAGTDMHYTMGSGDKLTNPTVTATPTGVGAIASYVVAAWQ
jgi:hypothetical protein